MSTQDRDEKARMFRPVHPPRCGCFDFDAAPGLAMSRCAEVSQIAMHIASAIVGAAREMELCDRALPLLIDSVIITLAVHVATHGTIIEQGTEDAERETIRVLTGMEQRIIEEARNTYAYARANGITAESVRAMREGDAR